MLPSIANILRLIADASWGINREVKPFVLDSTNSGSWPENTTYNYAFVLEEVSGLSISGGNLATGSSIITELPTNSILPLQAGQGTTLASGKIMFLAKPPM